MKALTIRQPWADAIVHGTKRTENRTWKTTHRGPVLIHAGVAYDPMGRFIIHMFGAFAEFEREMIVERDSLEAPYRYPYSYEEAEHD